MLCVEYSVEMEDFKDAGCPICACATCDTYISITLQIHSHSIFELLFMGHKKADSTIIEHTHEQKKRKTYIRTLCTGLLQRC